MIPSIINDLNTKLNSAIQLTEKGAANGVAELNSDSKVPNSQLPLGIANGAATLNDSGKVPETQLPSYVDDVVEYSSLSEFPTTGETGKIYVAIDTGYTYRWSGSIYVKFNDVKITYSASEPASSIDGDIWIDSDDDYSDSGITDVTVGGTSVVSSGVAVIPSIPSVSSVTVTLTASGWSGNAQTVSVSGVTASNIVVVSPSSTSYLAYGEAEVRATAQGSGTLTFRCESTPSVDLTINVIIIGA